MKPEILENSDGGWAKSREIVPATVERSSLREIRLKPKTLPKTAKSGVQLRDTVRPGGRVAVTLGALWILVAFWAYPAHGWWRTMSGVGSTSDWANATIRDASGDVVAVGQISGDFGVVKISGTTGEQLWRREIDGTETDIYEDAPHDLAQAVAVDGSGDVIAAGYLRNTGTSYDFTVIKFSGATGDELWRQEIDGTGAGDDDSAQAVAVDGSGNVIAVGHLYNSGTGRDFTVINFSGATGDELWRQQIDGTGSGAYDDDLAQAVAVDASGDVIAAGHLSNIGTNEDFTVIKFSGATGDQLWRQEIDGTGTIYDLARAVAVDGSGDVIAAGLLGNIGTNGDFTVIKFSGVTGDELWRQEIDGTGGAAYFNDEAQAVAVDGSGDVIAAGYLENRDTNIDYFTVIKFSGATGDELWRRSVYYQTSSYNDRRQAVAVDGSGDVIAAGYLVKGGTDKDFTVIKFSGATGDELWRQEVDGTGSDPEDETKAVTVDSSGDVIAAGYLDNSSTRDDFTVIKFSGATGDELWRQEIDGTGSDIEDETKAVAVDGSGNVIAAGHISNYGTNDDFTVIKFSGVTGGELWRQRIDGTGSYGYDLAEAVAVDASGDVIAAGRLYDSGTGYDFTVIKFSGATGDELWRQQIDGTGAGNDDSAQAVAVDGSGNVIAVGYLYNSGTGRDFTVINFSGATGDELWRQQIDGTGSLPNNEEAQAVAVDGSGDVIAAGYLTNSGTGYDFTVIKFSGATGYQLWRQEINGPGSGYAEDMVQAVAVDGSGDVIAAGYLTNSGGIQLPRYDFTVIKFSGATGDELWRQKVNGTFTGDYVGSDDAAQAVAVDGSGDVIAAGYLENRGTGYDFAIVKFSGATGSWLWSRRGINGTDGEQDWAQAVAVDGSGDVIAAGYLQNSGTYYDFTVIKFSGASGNQLWRQEINGPGSGYAEDMAQAVAVDGSGNVIAAGSVYNSGTARDFTVIKLSGTTGDFGGTRTAKSLLVRDDASGSERRQLKVLSKDPDWPLPQQGSANDPALAGASVRLANPYSAEQATFDLPPGPYWRVTSSVSGAVNYVYRDPSGINGPCIVLQAFSGKRVRAVCNGSKGLIPFTLDEPSQGELVVSVQFGAAEPQCAWFGGRVTKDQGTSNPGPTGIFKAKDAISRAAACP